jgi:hypothetical protein
VRSFKLNLGQGENMADVVIVGGGICGLGRALLHSVTGQMPGPDRKQLLELVA